MHVTPLVFPSGIPVPDPVCVRETGAFMLLHDSNTHAITVRSYASERRDRGGNLGTRRQDRLRDGGLFTGLVADICDGF